MDRALKERIIGAIVLVAVVVLVVPVFLDGPPDSAETVSERVPLPGQSDQKAQTVVLNRDREEPVPAAATEPPEREPQRAAESPAPRDVEPDTPPARSRDLADAPSARTEGTTAAEASPATETPAAATSSTGMWAVQLGSFSQQENAENLASGLRKQGFAAFLSQLNTADGQLHRVRIGPQGDRAAAEAMAARLAEAGHSGQVVPHP